MRSRQKITTFLWFDKNAEEAVRFYLSVFKDSKILAESRWGEGGSLPKGSILTIKFQLEGQEFVALNGGPAFRFTEAISLLVNCDSQAEVDALWEKLGAGSGDKGQCGWIKDRFGLSWQVVPTSLLEMLHDEDAAKRQRVMDAMMPMKKLDLAKLKQAFEGR